VLRLIAEGLEDGKTTSIRFKALDELGFDTSVGVGVVTLLVKGV